MIGLFSSKRLPDPDRQHGPFLEQWLSRNGIGKAAVLWFDEAPSFCAEELPGLWWHHAAGADLPKDALQPRVVRRLKGYIEEGGKLFLSRGACAYVEPLGLGRAPDVFSDRPPRFFLRPGMRFQDGRHPLARGLRPLLTTYGRLFMESYCDLCWRDRWPSDGALLGTKALNGAVFRNEAVCWEWFLGRGRVTAFGGAALHLYDHDDPCRPQLKRFVNNIIRYLEMPCIPSYRPEGDAPPPALYKDSYEAARLGDARLAFDRGRPVLVEISLASFGMKRPEVGACLKEEDKVVQALNPVPTRKEPGNLCAVVEIDSRALEEGYYDLVASFKDGDHTVREETVPLLLRDHAPKTFRWMKDIAVLSNDRSVLEIDMASGCVKGMYAKDHPFGLNFMANETNSILGSSEAPPWFGTVQGLCRASSGGGWLSFTNRNPRVSTAEAKEGRVRFTSTAPELPMNLTWGFESLPDRIRWSFSLQNEGEEDMEVGALHIPASLNTYFGLDGDQERTYCRRVMMHNLVCKRGSYLFAEPLAGRAPFLLVLPLFDEGFEAAWHDRDAFAGRQPAWEGLLYAGIFTRAEWERRSFDPWYNGHASLLLKPGESRTFAFDLFFIDTYDEINRVLLEEGKPVLEPHPGMVVPVDMPARFRVRSRTPFRVEAAEGLSIKERKQGGDFALFDLHFERPGEYCVKVSTEKGESLYHYRAIPPLEDLIKARGAFIATRQQYRDPGSVRDFAFLMWDAEEEDVVSNPEYTFLAGGSDECCLADPVFLAAKQIFFPDEREIEGLEQYVEHFLFNKVQSRADFGVRRWISSPGSEVRALEGHDIGDWTDRSFNYPHVFNIYYSLYAAGKRYGLTRTRTPMEYLEMAARTALAYFEFGVCLNAAREQGNMGDRALELILDALQSEGMEDLGNRLRSAVQPKIDHMTKNPFPFASEYAFDTTGYEGVYWIRKMAGDSKGMDSVLSTILGTRGKAPFWYHYGGDVHWGWGNSKFIAPDEICFNYMCGLNARVLLDAYLTRRLDPKFLEYGFAGTVAPWVLVDPDGTAHDFCGWEPGRVRFDPWSSEMGIGIAATLFALRSIVILDGMDGPSGYGCLLREKEDVIHIEPRDGVRRRLFVGYASGRGAALSVDRAAIRRARFFRSEGRVELDLEPAARGVDRCRVRVGTGSLDADLPAQGGYETIAVDIQALLEKGA